MVVHKGIASIASSRQGEKVQYVWTVMIPHLFFELSEEQPNLTSIIYNKRNVSGWWLMDGNDEKIKWAVTAVTSS